MAATVITNTTLTKRGTAVAYTATAAVAANEGALITPTKADQKVTIILENSSATTALTAVIKAGNALQGVADLEIDCATSSKQAVQVESGKYMDVSGDNKGKILVIDKLTTATTLKVACIETV